MSSVYTNPVGTFLRRKSSQVNRGLKGLELVWSQDFNKNFTRQEGLSEVASTNGLRPLKISLPKFIERSESSDKGRSCRDNVSWGSGLEVKSNGGLQEVIFILANRVHEESLHILLYCRIYKKCNAKGNSVL